MNNLRAISLWQPWASLMALNAKMIETRSWPTHHRGLVAIHAARKWNAELRSQAHHHQFWNALGTDDLPLGQVVAVGNLQHCRAVAMYPEAIPPTDSPEFAFGDYSPGRYMWVFDHIWKLSTPVFVTGRQGFWTLTEGETDVVTTLMPDDWEEEFNG